MFISSILFRIYSGFKISIYIVGFGVLRIVQAGKQKVSKLSLKTMLDGHHESTKDGEFSGKVIMECIPNRSMDQRCCNGYERFFSLEILKLKLGGLAKTDCWSPPQCS